MKTIVSLLLVSCLYVQLRPNIASPTRTCRETVSFQSQINQVKILDHLTTDLPISVKQQMDTFKKNDQLPQPSLGQVHSKSSNVTESVFGNTTCPTTLSTNHSLPLEDRRICPYFYVITRDLKRFPVTIAEARCKCQHCVGVNEDNVCEPVYFPKNVLRYVGCVNGTQEYRSEIYQVQNGCVCAKQQTTESIDYA